MVAQQDKTREQLYMLEFLVNQLNLPSENVEKSPLLSVHLKFLDFHPFVVNQDEFSKKAPLKDAIDFSSGKSCVFSKQPADLMSRLKTEPVIVEVHGADDECSLEPPKPLCTARLHLSGCLCQIETAMKSPGTPAEPYTVRDTYELLEEDEKPAGTLELFLRLSCLGESIVTHFHVDDKSFKFKNTNAHGEFSCVKLPQEETQNKFWTPRSKPTDSSSKPEPKTIVGVSSLCSDLAKADPRPPPPPPPPDPPAPDPPNAPRVEKTQPTVENNFREKSGFDPATFISPRKFPCRGRVCPGGLCSGLDMRSERLRGGNDEMPIHSMQTLLAGACRSLGPGELPPQGCQCAAKSGNFGKVRKKCSGVDCLIRAFRETEKFVESIGKGPGLAGLGLMDPRESPYFGRPRYRPPARPPDRRQFPSLPPAAIKSSSFVGSVKKLPVKPVEKVKATSAPLKKVRDDVHSERKADRQFSFIKPPESGPCGEPVCQSQKKPHDLDALSRVSGSTSSRMKKASSVTRRRRLTKLKLKKAKNLRNYERNYSHVKVGKRVMRLVEATSQRSCFGHRSCVEIRARIPGNMGWLWTTSNVPGRVRPRAGWKPGAISRRVWSILKQAKAIKEPEEADEHPVTLVKGKKGKIAKSRSLLSVARSQKKRRELGSENELPPTLHIHRKNGDYYVTMYPVKSENFNHPELQEAVKPIQFKVTKDKTADDGSNASSSIADDMEFEFSPPAAIHRYTKTTKRRDLETQVIQQEILDAFKGSTPPAGKKKKKGGKK